MPTQKTVSIFDTDYYPTHEYYRSVCGCEPDEFIYGTSSYGVRTVVKALPEHRTKPADLILGQTAQPKQYTELIHSGRRVKTSFRGYCGYSCPSSTSYFPYTLRENVSAGTSYISLLSTPDWETPLRLEIKDLLVNLGATLAEYRQTASMFGDFAKAARGAWRSYRGVRRGRRKAITPCNVAASELVYSYGIAPLANDVFDSVMALTDRLGKPIWKRFTLFRQEENEFTKSDSISTYYCKGRTSVRPSFWVELDPNFGDFTLGNPAEIAWELVPYSFVVDWALPIGDMLSALDALRGTKRTIGTLTKKVWYHQDRVEEARLNDGWVYEKPAYYHYESHERSLYYTVPLPRLPTWDPSRSWRTVMHGISLLTQLNQRCK